MTTAMICRPSPSKPPPEDLTGQSRFTRNLAFAWGGYLVNVVAGFIMPRLISDHLGQTTLGVWDFAWSVVSYFGLIQMNLGSSVNRYVARHRAVKDWLGLSRSVSTIGLFMKVAGSLMVVASILTAWLILPAFREKLGADFGAARWIVLILGSQVGTSVILAVYGAVIVGCHRWDMHNGISAVVYGTTAMGMILVLVAGGGLLQVALVHAVIVVAGEVLRWRLVKRVCPELVVNYRRARWATFLEQFRFSFKGLMPSVADLLSNQLLSILVTLALGPAALAVFMRPKNLVRQLQVFASKFGSILVPTASSLQAQNDQAALRRTFQEASTMIAALMAPAVLALVVYGDVVIRLWMGSEYVYSGLVPILAVGSLPACVQEPVFSILAGMNQHGRVALAKLAGALVAASLVGVGLLVFKWGLLAVALSFVIPQSIIDGLVTPIIACRRTRCPVAAYYWSTFCRPCLVLAPFVLCLWLSRLALPTHLLLAAVAGGCGIALLLGAYWAFVLPPEFRQNIVARLRPRLVGATSS